MDEQKKVNPKSNFFSAPVAIIIAGALISGAVVFTNTKNNAPEKTEQPKIEAGINPMRGEKSAKVEIVTFSDYQCPFCGRGESVVAEIAKAYPKDVKIAFRNFPLEMHKYAEKAAEASECAMEQQKFWEYHDLLFAKQEEWSGSKDANVEFKKYAKSLKLDSAKFDSCLDTNKYSEEIKKDLADGETAGVNGTPAFFVNGEILIGADGTKLKQMVENALK